LLWGARDPFSSYVSVFCVRVHVFMACKPHTRHCVVRESRSRVRRFVFSRVRGGVDAKRSARDAVFKPLQGFRVGVGLAY
jgi:hypothetical protein